MWPNNHVSVTIKHFKIAWAGEHFALVKEKKSKLVNFPLVNFLELNLFIFFAAAAPFSISFLRHCNRVLDRLSV